MKREFQAFTAAWLIELEAVFPMSSASSSAVMRDTAVHETASKVYDRAMHSVTFFQHKPAVLKVQHGTHRVMMGKHEYMTHLLLNCLQRFAVNVLGLQIIMHGMRDVARSFQILWPLYKANVLYLLI